MFPFTFRCLIYFLALMFFVGFANSFKFNKGFFFLFLFSSLLVDLKKIFIIIFVVNFYVSVSSELNLEPGRVYF